VVGFDLAGPEAGFPPTAHLDALQAARDGGLRLTIHAGEGDGPRSIEQALDCGAERVGHGVRIVEDVALDEDGVIIRMGAIAARVHDGRTPLEVCPTSNLHTRAVAGPTEHPLGLLHRNGFVVTLSTDNRLMSRIVPSDEFAFALEHQAMSVADLRQITLQAVDAAFCDDATRRRVRARVEAGYPPV
jgi:adenosine deaminase